MLRTSHIDSCSIRRLFYCSLMFLMYRMLNVEWNWIVIHDTSNKIYLLIGEQHPCLKFFLGFCFSWLNCRIDETKLRLRWIPTKNFSFESTYSEESSSNTSINLGSFSIAFFTQSYFFWDSWCVNVNRCCNIRFLSSKSLACVTRRL